MKILSSPNHSSPTILVITIITLVALNTNPTNSLRCSCTVCGENTDYCDTSNDSDSECYKSVQALQKDGKYIWENGSLVNLVSYGCLSGGGSISHMQCRLNTNTFTNHRVVMRCCKDHDFCNEEFSDPFVADNRTWNVPENQIHRTDETEINILTIYGTQILVVASIAATFLFCVPFMIKCCHPPHSNESTTSTCFLKSDLDKFDQFVAKSSASSHSTYSISDDICHKTEPSQADDSFVTTDMTSGIGEPIINPITLAREVDLKKTDPVGNGRFGRVFRFLHHGEYVAVKAFKSFDTGSWQHEDNIFRYLNHDNIVRFIASETTTVNGSMIEIWMFLEYCPLGSLNDFLDKNEILGPEQAVRILYSIINGLNYLHEDYARVSKSYKPSIAHRDIKSRNVLMKTPDCCCIADFGHALVKEENSPTYVKHQNLQVGTIRYMAPEILREDPSIDYRKFTTFAQADVYQYGLILWEVCHRTALDILHPAGSHKLPYDGVVPPNPAIQDMVKIVCEDQYRPPRLESWGRFAIMNELAQLMVECWKPVPKDRKETLDVKLQLKSIFDRQQMPYNGNHSVDYSEAHFSVP